MKKIILVEDDTAIQEVFLLALDAGKYEVLTFNTGDAILEGELAIPDLFMLDKNIAGTNGVDLCRFIKASHLYNRTPVVILSASPNIKELAKGAGADDFIVKPFTLKTLREVTAKYTGEQ
jgi:DNA-binding response OmpR family regulator